jgi:flagellin-like hook-associated protein FlgL
MSSVLKGQGGDKARAAAGAMEWMANDASTSCLICSKQWSMKNRRHHCRRCGRLVCNECSMRTMACDDDEEAKRICDDCYEGATRKQQVKLEVNYHREREMQLLHATSKVSDSLVRVYFLDGSFKTVFYDENTTSTEIASKLCFAVKLALFEVEKDLRNTSDYELIPADECIANIIARWGSNNLNHAKLIIPICDINSVVKSQSQAADRRSAPLGANASTADHLAHLDRERELKEASKMSYGPGYRSSFSHFDGGAGGTSRDSVMDHPVSRGTFMASRRMSGIPAGLPASTSRDSVALGAGDMGGAMDAMNAIQELQDVYAKLEGVSQDNMRLMKEITDVKKKYDILRTIHTKTNKNTRELRKEMDGLKAAPADSNSGAGATGRSPSNERASNRTSFGLNGLSQTLTGRPQSLSAGGGSFGANGNADFPPGRDVPPAAGQGPGPAVPGTSASGEEPPPPGPQPGGESDASDDDDTAVAPPSVLYKGAMLRKSTGVTKLFKPTFGVFTEVSLSFYSDESMRRLDRSCLTKDAHATAGSKDPLWFTITTDTEQIVLKTDSSETSELLVSVINEAAQSAVQEIEERQRRIALAALKISPPLPSSQPMPPPPPLKSDASPGPTPSMSAIPEDEENEENDTEGAVISTAAIAATAANAKATTTATTTTTTTTTTTATATASASDASSSPTATAEPEGRVDLEVDVDTTGLRDAESVASVVSNADRSISGTSSDIGAVHYKSPVLRQRTGALSKQFKANYVVFSDTHLNFYTDESLKKLEKSMPARGSSAIVGPRDPLCLTISNGRQRLVLKLDSEETPRELVGVINGIAAAAGMQAASPAAGPAPAGPAPSPKAGSGAGTALALPPTAAPASPPPASPYRRGSRKELDASENKSSNNNSNQPHYDNSGENKYEELRHIDSTYQVKVFLDKVAGIEAFFRVFDDIMHTTLGEGVGESQQVTHTYEIISAMQTLYAGILDYGETWTSVARDWLLRMLRQHMRLPVQEPELLMAVIQCISRENMMFSPDTSEVVNQIIEMSFEDVSDGDGDPDFANSTEGILAGVTRMIETLEQVVEDLVPLLPEDFNVITMYSAKANKKIKNDISTFYAANKTDITNREVLTLLSFADSQKYHLSKFGVDTSVVDTLQSDLLKHYSTMVTTLMRQWIGRICTADETCELQLAKGMGLGMTSHWPEDLLSCVGEQLNLAVKELKPSACERVCTLVLESLTLLVTRQKAWLAANISKLAPERLCAYVNNLDRFAGHLSERGEAVVQQLGDANHRHKLRTISLENAVRQNTGAATLRKDSLDDIAASSRLEDGFRSIGKTLLAESRVGLKELVTLVCSDFKDGLAGGLFVDDWAESAQVAETLKTTLEDYVGDLAQWLASKDDLDKVILGILRAVTSTYLEMLLTSGLLVTPRVAERLAQDVHVLLVAFSEFEEHVSEEALDSEIRPLKAVASLMAKDPRQMRQFVRDELYPIFGK